MVTANPAPKIIRKGLVGLGCRRSDLLIASSESRLARNEQQNLLRPAPRSGCGNSPSRLHAHVVRIKWLAPHKHRPQDACVLVCQRHHRLLGGSSWQVSPGGHREVCGSTQTDRASSHWAQCAGAALHLAWALGSAQDGARLGRCRCNARPRHRPVCRRQLGVNTVALWVMIA